MPNYLFGDSSDGNQPALLVQNTGSDNGLVIVGVKRYGGNSFLVLNNGQVWAEGRIESLGGFWTSKDVLRMVTSLHVGLCSVVIRTLRRISRTSTPSRFLKN